MIASVASAVVRGLCSLVFIVAVAVAWAQPFVWPEEYGDPEPGGVFVQGWIEGNEEQLFNPFAGEIGGQLARVVSPPDLVVRDWLGDRSFRKPDGSFNLLFAAEIEELERDREFIITIREGWYWSDGTEITATDYVGTQRMLRDLEIGQGSVRCAYVDDEPAEIEELGRYRFRVRLPVQVVNGIIEGWCQWPVPMHIYGPAYDEGGAAGVNALWGPGTDPSEIVSGGMFVPLEIRPGERIVLEANPVHRAMMRSAGGTPIPAPDRIRFEVVPDRSQLAALAVTGAIDRINNVTLDELRALREGIDSGNLSGRIIDGGPGEVVDFITYNFNHPDPCKREMFRRVDFRRAMSLLIDREALVQAALNGIGTPARMWRTGFEPFSAPEIPPLEFAPERAVELLAGIGFTELGDDGVLRNPDSGCRVAFDLIWNGGNNRRAAIAQVTSQTAAEYGVEIDIRQVDQGTWIDAIVGTSLPRRIEYDAVIWGLAGGDIDNPSGSNVFPVAANLNAWNKSETDVEAWEILLGQLTRDMGSELDLERRIELFEEREALLRTWLPVTPLIAPREYWYIDGGNLLPERYLDAIFLEFAGPGNVVGLLEAPRNRRDP